MAQIYLRDQARVWRKSGASLNEITHKLQVPKSTVRYWCRDITLSKQQQSKLFAKQKLGGVMSAEKKRIKRIVSTQKLLNEGIREIGNLSAREILLVSVALYWAEGYKKGNDSFGFTNSDPKMIKFIINWLINIYGIPKSEIAPRVCINQTHKYRIATINKFWSQTTGIPLLYFSKPTFIKVVNKKKYLNRSDYYGTLRIKVRKSTNFKRKIMGWIEGISKTV